MLLVFLFEVAIYFLYLFFHLFLLGGGSPFTLIYFFLLLNFFLILFFIWLTGSDNQFRNDEFKFSWFFDQLENKSTLFNCHCFLSKKIWWLSNSWNFILYNYEIGCWMVWWAGCLFIFILTFLFTFWFFGIFAGQGGDPQGAPGPNDHFALRFVKTQEGELTYQCGLCGYLPNSTNKSIGYAKNRVCMHIKNVHSEPTNVVCKGCTKKFKNKESLRVHKIKYCRDPESAGGLSSPATAAGPGVIAQLQM